MKKEVEKSERLYTITLNEKQLITLEQMTDQMMRIICGQLDLGMQEWCEAAWNKDHATEEYPYGICAPGWSDMRNELEEHLQAIRKLCWNCDPCTSYGIHYHPVADELYDMHCVLRKFRYDYIFTDEDRETMRYTVLSDTPLHTSKEPLIKVEPCSTEGK